VGKGILITLLVFITGAAFVGGVWVQKNSAPGIFRGTITGVDLTNKEFAVQNGDGEMVFKRNDATRVNGPPAENAGMDLGILKEGMKVTVKYGGGAPKRIANQIDIEATKLKALQGLSWPFDCGVNVC
jgi:hypothetical protein